MDDLEKVLSSVAKKIVPSKKEINERKKFAEEVLNKIRNKTDKPVVLVGSVAKGTVTKDKRELDIFILFPDNYDKKQLEQEIFSIAKKAFPNEKLVKSYAEHPYVKIKVDSYTIDLVPAYNFNKKIKSAVDRSVLHAKFVIEHLDDSLRKDVILLKSLLKANSLYGAELKVEGFSGYLCELLIIHYKGIVPLINNAIHWRIKLIDFSSAWTLEEAYKKFKKSLIVIDPTDPNRNVAAALSEENLTKFKKLCKKLKKNPKEELFLKTPPTFYDKLKNKSAIVLQFRKPQVSEEILWGQLKKLSRRIAYLLKDFSVKTFEEITDNSLLIAVLPSKITLPETIWIKGPPIHMKEHVKQFKKKHKVTIEKQGFVYAIERRKIKTVKEAITLLRNIEFPSHISREFIVKYYRI